MPAALDDSNPNVRRRQIFRRRCSASNRSQAERVGTEATTGTSPTDTTAVMTKRTASTAADGIVTEASATAAHLAIAATVAAGTGTLARHHAAVRVGVNTRVVTGIVEGRRGYGRRWPVDVRGRTHPGGLLARGRANTSPGQHQPSMPSTRHGSRCSAAHSACFSMPLYAVGDSPRCWYWRCGRHRLRHAWRRRVKRDWIRRRPSFMGRRSNSMRVPSRCTRHVSNWRTRSEALKLPRRRCGARFAGGVATAPVLITAGCTVACVWVCGCCCVWCRLPQLTTLIGMTKDLLQMLRPASDTRDGAVRTPVTHPAPPRSTPLHSLRR